MLIALRKSKKTTIIILSVMRVLLHIVVVMLLEFLEQEASKMLRGVNPAAVNGASINGCEIEGRSGGRKTGRYHQKNRKFADVSHR